MRSKGAWRGLRLARMLSKPAGGRAALPPNHPGAQTPIVHLLFLLNPILMPPIYCELNQHSKSDTSNNSNFIGFTFKGIAMSPQAQDRSGEKQKSRLSEKLGVE